MTHLSHLYPSGSSLYPGVPVPARARPDETLDRWRAVKGAACETIVAHGGTISHQHGVGRTMPRSWQPRRATLGMAALGAVARTLDPGWALNPGVLLAGGDAMSADRILALDVGTQSVRAIVFDPSRRAASPPPGSRSSPMSAASRAAASRMPTCTGGRSARRAAAVGDAGVAAATRSPGVALTTQRGTIVVTDEAGEPLRRAMVWLDRLPGRGAAPDRRQVGLAFRALGRHARRWRRSWRRPRRTARAERARDVWARVRHYLLLSGFLTHRLTGRVRRLGRLAGRLPAVRLQRLRWAGPGDWKWQARRSSPAWLPRARPAGRARSARSRDAAAAATGHPRRLAAHRRRRGQGLRGARLGRARAGHRGAVATARRRRSTRPSAVRRGHPARAAVPGRDPRRLQPRGPGLPRLLDGRLVQARVRRARRSPRPTSAGVAPEALFDELVAATPPGSMGLILQPYWSPGVRIPGPEAKGAIIGFGDVHTRAHLYRAILEGLAYALREGAERTAKRTGCRSRELRVSRRRRRRARPRSS